MATARRLLVALSIASSIAAAADARAAPSPTFTRAVERFEQADYLAATIDLREVLDGATDDAVEQRQHAELLWARALHELGYHALALDALNRIALADDPHAARAEALPWLVEVASQLGATYADLGGLEAYAPGTDGVSQLGELADAYWVLRADWLYMMARFDEALDAAGRVPDGASQAAAAQRAIGEVWFRLGDVAKGVEALRAAARDPAVAPRAVRALVDATRARGDAAAAAGALREIAAGDGPMAPYATYAASRIAHEIDALRGLGGTFDALTFVVTCGRGHVDDLVAAMQVQLDELTTWLNPDKYEDDAERWAYAERHLHEPSPAWQVLRVSIEGSEHVQRLRELTRERDLLARADDAWQRTAAAEAIATDLELRLSLAQADAGKALHHQLGRLREELALVATATGGVSADSSGDGIIVPDALCEQLGLPSTAASSPTPAPPRAPATRGCAGCGAGDPAPGLLLVALLMLRRRRPPA